MKNDGWIAVAGKDSYKHAFGGELWPIRDPYSIGGGPHLLLTLDTSDPKLGDLTGIDSRFLPLCSYINCDVWTERQAYNFDPIAREIQFLSHVKDDVYCLPDDLAFDSHLPMVPLSLRAMSETELVCSEGDYWEASDDFVGGGSFIRVLGPPLWLQNQELIKCSCGRAAQYVCSIGYEHPEDYGITGQRPFFIGEAALYFFLCPDCRVVVVISQPS